MLRVGKIESKMKRGWEEEYQVRGASGAKTPSFFSIAYRISEGRRWSRDLLLLATETAQELKLRSSTYMCIKWQQKQLAQAGLPFPDVPRLVPSCTQDCFKASLAWLESSTPLFTDCEVSRVGKVRIHPTDISSTIDRASLIPTVPIPLNYARYSVLGTRHGSCKPPIRYGLLRDCYF